MKTDAGEKSQRSIVIISFDDDYATRFIDELQTVAATVHVSPLMRSVEAAIDSFQPAVIVFDLQTIKTERHSVVDMMAEIHLAHPGIRKIGLGYEADSLQIVAAMRAGACDFLDRSASPQIIRGTILKQLQLQDQAPGSRKGKVVALVGAGDRDGAADVAVNLAARIVDLNPNEDVLLLDLNLDNSHFEIDFDVEVTYSVREAVDELLRLTKPVLTGLLPRHKSGLYILPLATKTRQDDAISPQELATLLSVLRSFFQVIVVNAACLRHKSCQPYLMPICDHLLVVCSQRIGAVRIAANLFETPTQDAAAAVELIVADYDPTIALSADEIGRRIGLKVLKTLPIAQASLANAHNAGTPLVLQSPVGRYARAIDELARHIIPELPDASRVSLAKYGEWLRSAIGKSKDVA